MVGFVYFQAYSTFALQVRADGLSAAAYGALLSLNGLLIATLELPLTTLTQRLPVRPTIAAGLLLIGVGFTVNAITRGVPLLGLSVVLWTIGEMVHSPVIAAHIATLAPPRLAGRYQGLFGRSPLALWPLCGALGVIAAALTLIGGDSRAA